MLSWHVAGGMNNIYVWQEDADAIVAAAEKAQGKGQVVGMDIGMRWNPALHELRRLAVVEGNLGELKSARLTLAFKQWPREWQVTRSNDNPSGIMSGRVGARSVYPADVPPTRTGAALGRGACGRRALERGGHAFLLRASGALWRVLRRTGSCKG